MENDMTINELIRLLDKTEADEITWKMTTTEGKKITIIVENQEVEE